MGAFFSLFFVRNKFEVDDLFEEYTGVTLDEDEEAEITYDKHKINSGRQEGGFDTFYKELDQILDQIQNSQVVHLPITVSVSQLISKVLRYFTK